MRDGSLKIVENSGSLKIVKCLSLHVEQSVRLQSAPKTKITDYIPDAAVLFSPETLCPRYTIIFFQQINKKSLF